MNILHTVLLGDDGYELGSYVDTESALHGFWALSLHKGWLLTPSGKLELSKTFGGILAWPAGQLSKAYCALVAP